MSKSKVKLPKNHASYIKSVQDKQLRNGMRKVKLKRLAKLANDFHRKSTKAWRRGLEHARDAGFALCKAKKLHRKRGTWQPWLRDNFKGSCETARVYMRVYRQWDDTEVKDARKSGALNSLNTFLALTAKAKEQAAAPLGPEAAIPSEAELRRKDLLQLISTRLRLLDNEVLTEIEDNFPQLWVDMVEAAKEHLLPECEWKLLHPDDEYEPEPYRDEEEDREHERRQRRMAKRLRRANAG